MGRVSVFETSRRGISDAREVSLKSHTEGVPRLVTTNKGTSEPRY